MFNLNIYIVWKNLPSKAMTKCNISLFNRWYKRCNLLFDRWWKRVWKLVSILSDLIYFHQWYEKCSRVLTYFNQSYNITEICEWLMPTIYARRSNVLTDFYQWYKRSQMSDWLQWMIQECSRVLNDFHHATRKQQNFDRLPPNDARKQQCPPYITNGTWM